MSNVVENVNQLTETEVVQVSNELFANVYDQVTFEEVARSYQGVADVRPLVGLDETTLRRRLDPDASVALGRQLLVEFADDPEFAPLVHEAIEKVRGSDDLPVLEVALAIGLLVNLTLLVATVEGKVERHANGTLTWSITKKQPGPALVKALIEPLGKIIRPLTG